MNLKDFFKEVVEVLKKKKVRFALAGGLVASLYRHEERSTKDLDFLILTEKETQKNAMDIIESFDLTPHIVRQAELEGGPLFAIKRQKTPPYMIIGRKKDDTTSIGLDFILPAVPWFEEALNRAEKNLCDFGFGQIPCLTVEDLIVSKLYALKNDTSRFKDLDDLKSIFLAQSTGLEIDLIYISSALKKINLKIPKLLRKHLPKALSVIR